MAYTDNMEKKLQIIFGDVTFGVKGEDFQYIFSYQTGGPESFYAAGREWLYRTPKPTFWRALTDNDKGCKFQMRSGVWMSADLFMACTDFKVSVDGQEIPKPLRPNNNKYGALEYAEKAAISFCYETITNPKTEVWVSYEVDGAGSIRVNAKYEGKPGLPQLPVFGMRFIMPTKAEGFCYEGLSGETYPDRMAGGIKGVYEVQGLPVTPYLVPQDCGMHMDTEWVEVCRSTSLDNSRSKKGAGNGSGKDAANNGAGCMRVEADTEKFAFSCLPYTAQELENASHQEELPPKRRTVLCIYGAVRGVGGIDSWGTDVEEAYHVDGETDKEVSFKIRFHFQEA